MNCDDVRRLVDASVDRELDLVREIEIEAHLEDCPACAQVYEAQRHLHAQVEQHDLYYRAPAHLHHRVRLALGSSASLPVSPGATGRALKPTALSIAWQRWSPLAASAAIVFFVVAGVLMLRARPSSERSLVDEVVASHIRSLLPGHLTDVPSSDQHTVKPWFAGRVDFSPPVSDFADSGFPLVGGRVDYVGGRTVAVAVYKRRQHILNLFMSPASGEESPETPSLRGYNIVHWTGGGIAFWLVSDLNDKELRDFAELVRKGR